MPIKRLVLLCVLAIVLRAAYVLHLGGMRRGGDTGHYISWADSIAKGDMSGFGETTHFPAFSVLLSFNRWVGASWERYTYFLHLILTVILLFCSSRIFFELYGETTAVWGTALLAVFPSFVFWYAFILSEITFLAALSFFILCFIRNAKVGSLATLSLLILAGALLLAARPHATAVIVGAAGWTAWEKFAGRKRLPLILCSGLLGLILGAVVFQLQLYRTPLLAQSLWFGVQRATEIKSMERVHEAERSIERKASELGREVSELKAEEALGFIRAHPLSYLFLSAERSVCFWFPWIFASGWSWTHRIMDALLSCFLFGGAVLSWIFVRREQPLVGSLFWMVIGVTLLASLTAVDTDARYRFPAEYLAILLAPQGWIRAFAG